MRRGGAQEASEGADERVRPEEMATPKASRGTQVHRTESRPVGPAPSARGQREGACTETHEAVRAPRPLGLCNLLSGVCLPAAPWPPSQP